MQILIDVKNILCDGWGVAWGVGCGLPTADECSLRALPLKTNPGMRFQFSPADDGVPLLLCLVGGSPSVHRELFRQEEQKALEFRVALPLI